MIQLGYEIQIFITMAFSVTKYYTADSDYLGYFYFENYLNFILVIIDLNMINRKIK